MSSHHIVREEQEPALLVLSLEGARPDLFMQLLEWNPILMATDSSADRLVEWGVKIDVLLTRPERAAEWGELLAFQQPVEIIPVPYLESIPAAAIAYLNRRKCHSVNICTPFEPELASFLAKEPSVEKVVYSPKAKWIWAKESRFEKWLKAGTILKVRPGEASLLGTSGLQINAEGRWEVVADGLVSLKAPQPFWIGEEMRNN